MPDHTRAPETDIQTAAHEVLVVNLRNAHGLEKQVITVLESHLKLLTEYPDLHARLTAHVVESREQARRLEACLEACGSSASLLKNAFLSVMGLAQSSMQGFSDDAVLKAVVADMMTEHLEIATYRTLLTLADMADMPGLRPRLEESLREEEAMAAWFDQNLEAITRRFVEVKAWEKKLAEETKAKDAAAKAADSQTAEPASEHKVVTQPDPALMDEHHSVSLQDSVTLGNQTDSADRADLPTDGSEPLETNGEQVPAEATREPFQPDSRHPRGNSDV